MFFGQNIDCCEMGEIFSFTINACLYFKVTAVSLNTYKIALTGHRCDKATVTKNILCIAHRTAGVLYLHLYQSPDRHAG